MLSCTDLCPLFICISCLCMHNDLLQVTCNKEFEFEFTHCYYALHSSMRIQHKALLDDRASRACDFQPSGVLFRWSVIST